MDIDILLNCRSKRSFFPSWPIKLASGISELSEFNSFIRHYRPEFSALEQKQKRKLSIFYPAIKNAVFSSHKNHNSKSSSKYHGYQIQLKRWPDFNAIHPSATILELCAKLVGQATSHRDIFASEQSPQETLQIEELLSHCEAQDLLTLSPDNDREPGSTRAANHSSFYIKLKHFLSGKGAA